MLIKENRVAKRELDKTELFKYRGVMTHGTQYDYEEAAYINNTSPMKIRCKEHGIFNMCAKDHILKGLGCPECSGKVFDTATCIAAAVRAHGDRYDYSKLIYKRLVTPVTIICKLHGKFSMTPNKHIHGAKCHTCVIEATRGLAEEEFIAAAIDKQGGAYDYSNIQYTTIRNHVVIGCPVHGVLKILPGTFLASGCVECVRDKLRCTRFIEKANIVHNNKWDYTAVKYVNTRTHIDVICAEHGGFNVVPSRHLCGLGCPVCKLNKTFSKRLFTCIANKKYPLLYSYYFKEVSFSSDPIVILCRLHGEYVSTPNKHLAGVDCPGCVTELKSCTQAQLLAKLSTEFILHERKRCSKTSLLPGVVVPATVIPPIATVVPARLGAFPIPWDSSMDEV